MQTIFVILTAIIVAIIAKKRGRSPWGWGIIGAVAFLVIDTVIALLLLAVFKDAIYSSDDSTFIIFFGAVKFGLFSALVAIFQAKLTHATVPAPHGQIK